MSLPSIKKIQHELGITDLSQISEKQQEEILVEAMKRDLGPALEFLHNHCHKKDNSMWQEDPSSKLGKMLIRIHAGDVLRQMAEKHFCHGKKLFFFNCCNGLIIEEEATEEDKKKEKPNKRLNPILLQLQVQNGDVNAEHC
jgi:hypothetical protein